MATGTRAAAPIPSPVVDIVAPEGEPLAAPLHPSFDYTRSTGPVLGAFFAGLRERRIVGVRDRSGRVHVPPVEFDPGSHAWLTPEDLVDVGATGTVASWTWVAEPSPGMLLAEPHALALVRLDGADTALLHVVAVASAEAMSTGMRVEAAWAEVPQGTVRDLVFVPEGTAGSGEDATPGVVPSRATLDESGRLVTPVELDHTHTAGFSERRFLRALVDGRILGRRRSNGPEVYVPPRDRCPADGVPMGEFVEVSDHGTVTTFGIVNVPFAGQKITPPYVTAYILLDGADLPIQHLVLGCEASEVRMGMRVRARWRPEGERPYSMAAIEYFTPSGEPDADRSTFDRHL